MRPGIILAATLLLALAGCAGKDSAPDAAGEASTPAEGPAPTPAEPAAGFEHLTGEEGARAFVSELMQARLAWDEERSRAFLSPIAAEQYTKGEGGLLLNGVDEPRFTGWELVSVEAVDANSFEVTVRIDEGLARGVEPGSSFQETLFVGPGPDLQGRQRAWIVRGARRKPA